MKYAKEVIDLMGAYPGRQFKMADIVRYVSRGRPLCQREREATRKATRRVLIALRESGQVDFNSEREKSALYSWKFRS